jgi:hypothetical protein
MQNVLFFLKKISLYIAAMFFALIVAYRFGMSPLLKAQTPPASAPVEPIDSNDFPELRGGSPNDPGGTGKTDNTTGEPENDGSASSGNSSSGTDNYMTIPPVSPEASQSPPAGGVVPQNQTPPAKQEISTGTEEAGLIFKHTTSYVGDLNSPDRDPFRKPYYILELEEQSKKPEVKIADESETKRIDDKMEAIRRWPLQDYKLVGVIWDVKNPKAMIVDPANTMHLLKRNYRIGDRSGVITSISEGSITVIQNNVPVIMELSTGGGNK